MTRVRRRFATALFATCVLAATLTATLLALLRASLPAVQGEWALPALTAPVSVTRDAHGVVTVRGRTRLDVARATGFVHAQERFFQMDLLRRVAAGELSALFGSAALERDRALRLHGLRAVARAVVARSGPAGRELLDAYADGVNAGLGALAIRPPEYLVLNAAPRAWRSEDSVLAVLAMFRRLSDPDASVDARRGQLFDCLPEPVAAFLAGDDADYAATLDGGALTPAPLPTPDQHDLRSLRDPVRGAARDVTATLAVVPPRTMGASNAWALAGRFTDDGRALVANDMHLGLAMPNIWFRMRLVVEDRQRPLDITGVTLPGGPAVVAGSNTRIAWGFTNAYGDWSDRVLLDLAAGDPDRYRSADGEHHLDYREETIEVKGGAALSLRVPLSIWGPVIRDRRGRAIAIRWLGHDPRAVNLDILALERATSVREVLDLGPTLGIPPQNLVVGDDQGNIGWTIAGRIPLRGPGYDPTRPYAGTSANAGWTGWLPAARYPRIENPPHGRIWTANQHVVSGEALHLIGDGGYRHGARARQIRDALMALEHADERDMLDLQIDDRALLLARWHALLTRVVTTGTAASHPHAARLRVLLGGWRGRASADSRAYPLIRAFRMRVSDRVFAALTAPCLRQDPTFRFRDFHQSEGPLWTLLRREPPHLLPAGFADWPALLGAVAGEVMNMFTDESGVLAPRTWGELNPAHLVHPLSRAIPVLAPLLDIGPDPTSGDRHMPRVMGRRGAASQRFAVRPGREDRGIFHMPGAQAGHPLSRYYRAGHQAWLDGAPTPFLPRTATHELWLMPPASGTRPARP